MRKFSAFAATLLLSVITSYSTANAYYLDSPHNDSNGIGCGDCHTMSAWSWPNQKDPLDPTNLDKTTRNAICNNCHGTDPADVARFSTNYVAGPTSKLHASSSTDASHGTWSTQCTDCHDPHFQPQLDWVLTDYDKLYVGGGYFDSQPTPSGSDTKINIVGYSGQPGFADFSLWKAKGGIAGVPNIDPTHAPDGNRGLQLVPDKSNPNIIGTYEIIDITGNVMTIKGSLTGDWQYKNFGVFYGQAIKSFMIDAHGNGFKDIKFFRPDIIAGDFGGFVDLRPSEPTPLGICQVCHAATDYWQTDGSIQTHNSDKNCSQCHVIYEGGNGGPKHETFIVDDNKTGDPTTKCSNCHPGIVADPTAHTNGCTTCHTATVPDINTNSLVNGQIDSDSGDPTTNLINAAVAPYTQYSFTGTIGADNTRLFDGTHTIADAGAGFTSIRCGECHNNKPAKLVTNQHGGHPVDFGKDAACTGCHTGASVLNNIHGTGTIATCTICHAGAPDSNTEFAGNPLNGVDADGIAAADGTAAAGSWATVTCIDCHVTSGYGFATIHHDNKTDGVVSGGLTDDGTICNRCHSVPGMQGDHSGSVNIAANCADCHNATRGTASGIPVLSGNAKVHDTCGACHEINGSNVVVLINPAGSPLVTAMPDGGDAGGALVGAVTATNTCESCHTSGFMSFHGAANHAGMVAQYGYCIICHTGTEAPAGGGPVPTGSSNKLHDSCEACHMATNGRLIDPATSTLVTAMPLGGDGIGGNLGGGQCNACHGEYFTDHNNVNHSATVANVTGECQNCHSGSEGMVTGMTIDTVPTPGNKVHDSCATCHTATGALYTPPSPNGWATAVNDGGTMGGKDGVNNCKTCHGAGYFITHQHTHSGVNTTALCSNCHTGDPVTATHNSNCADCHNLTTGARVNGSVNAGSYGGTAINVGDAGVNLGAGGTCAECHAVYFDGHIHGTPGGTAEHNAYGPTSGTIRQTCNTANCHLATATPYVGSGEVHESTSGGDGCLACHSAVNGSRISVAAGNDGATDCLDCHGGKFDNHSGRDTAHDVIMRAGIDEIISTSKACTVCHRRGGPSSGNPLFTNTWDGTEGIGALHTGGCAMCHDSNRANDLSPTYTPGNIQGIIQTDAVTIGCLDCHYSRRLDHMDHLSYDPDAGGPLNPGVLSEDSVLCTTCHTGGGTTGLLSDSNLMSIHNYSGSSCGTCHIAPGGSGPLKAPYDGLNGGQYGSCTVCHTSYANFATGHSLENHAEVTSTGSADCVSCHAGVLVGAGGVHDLTLACNNCHTDSATNGTLTGSASTHLISKEGGAAKACIDCHSAIDGDFSAHTRDTHAANVIPTGNSTCETCHTAPLIAGTHTGNCNNCHVDANTNGTDGSLRNVAQNHVMFNPSTCTTCHGTAWQTLHETSARIDHALEVAGLAACTSCHDATGGFGLTEITSLVNPATDRAGNMVHDACTGCHDADGAPKNPVTIPGSAATTLPAGGGNCGDCHGADYFDKHGHGTDTASYVVHDVDHVALTDISQNGGANSACYNCHDDASLGKGTLALGTWVAIKTEHATVNELARNPCSICHSYSTNLSGDPNTPDPAVVAAAVPGSGVTCITCHVPKSYVNSPATSPHGGHQPGDGTFVTSDTNTLCAACHGTASTNPNAPKGEMFLVIHGDGSNMNCVWCHTGGVAGAAPPNGSPADNSNVWNGSTWTRATPYACLACHTKYFGDNTGGHTHTHPVTATAACATCHDTGANPTTGAREANAAPFVATGDVHDTDQCATCHDLGVTNNNGALTGVAATADPAANGPAGDYECIDCHTTGWDSSHNTSSSINHTTSRVYDTANCNSCHNASAAAGFKVITSPYESTVAEVHYDHNATVCATCHNGANNGGLNGPTTKAPNMPSSGDCNNCHGTYFYSHTGASHTTLITITPCSGCHTGDIISDVSTHKNNCANCHNATNGARVNGSFNAASYRSAAVSAGDASVPAGGDAMWDCGECHAGYFDTHDHAQLNTIDSGIAEHAITAIAECAACHDTVTTGDSTNVNARNAVNAPYIGTGEVHELLIGGCMGCHDSTTGGPKGGTSAANWGPDFNTPSSGTCTNCHTGGFEPLHTAKALNIHLTARSLVTGDGACMACHDGVASGLAPVAATSPYMAGSEVHSPTGCSTCHDSAGALLSLIAANIKGYVSAMPTNGGNCQACHINYFNSHTHHDVAAGIRLNNDGVIPGPTRDESWNSPARTCDISGCHDGNNADSDGIPLNSWADILSEHETGCTRCHSSSGTSVWVGNPAMTNGPYTNVQDIILKKTQIVQCLNCHYNKLTPFNHGMTYVDHFAINTVPGQGQLGYSPFKANTTAGITECLPCHNTGPLPGGPDAIVTIHRGNCSTCHTNQPFVIGSGTVGRGTLLDGEKDLDDCANGIGNCGGYICTNCHNTNATAGANGWKPSMVWHGDDPNDGSYTEIRTRHENMVDGSGCLDCHTEMSSGMDSILLRHMPTGTVSECLVCHNENITPNTAVGVIDSGRNSIDVYNVVGGNTAQNCENCHTGATYRMHGLDNAGVGPAHDNILNPVPAAEDCTACHAMATLADNLALHGTNKNGCLSCHNPGAHVPAITNPDPQGGNTATVVTNGLPLSTDSGPAGNNQQQYCNDCHVNIDSFLMHGLANTDSEIVHEQLDPSTGIGATDCEACHTAAGATPEERRLAIHTNCAMCHSEASAPATTVIANGWSSATPAECEDCHVTPGNPGTYRLHYLAEANVASANLHNNITKIEAACNTCHTMANELQILQTHAGAAAGECLVCHNYTMSAPAGVAAQSIVNGATAMQNCTTCHAAAGAVGVAGAYGMHEMDNAGTEALHDQLDPSLGSGATDCEACHTAAGTTPEEKRLALHTGCAQCHTEATTPATTVIYNGWYSNTPAECEDCHDIPGNPGTYRLHYLAEAAVAGANLHNKITTVEAACDSCHRMANELQILQIHAGAAAGQCLVCHNYTLSAPIGTVATAINNGKGLAGSMQNCTTCHAAAGAVGVDGAYGMHAMDDAGVVPVHEFLAAPANTNSSCDAADCHPGVSGAENNATRQIRIETHTLAATTCVACHTGVATSDSGTAIRALIGNGVSGIPITCEACHSATGNMNQEVGADWYLHNDPDHTAAPLNALTDNGGGTPSADCVACHVAANQVLVHDTVPAVQGNQEDCKACHLSNGLLNSGGSANNYTDDATPDACIGCHTGGFTGHSRSTHAISVAPGVDESGGVSCAVNSGCHMGSGDTDTDGTPLNSWTDIFGEHNNSCVLCHDYNNGDLKNTPTVVANFAAISQAVPPDVKCIDCHSAKTASHGGHDPDHFDWTPTTRATCGASACHDGQTGGANETDVVGSLHGRLGCAFCHPTSGGRDGGKLGDNFSDAIGDSRKAAATVLFNEDCYACHNVYIADGATADHLYESQFGAAHLRTTDHDGVTATGANCDGCHDTGSGPNIVANTHTGCLSCHVSIDYNGSLVGAATYGTASGSGSCNNCHSSPVDYAGNFNLHTRSTDHDGVTAAGSNCGGCHDTSTGPNIVTNTHTGCGSCHNNILTDGRLVGAATYGTASGSGSCNDCHASPVDYAGNFNLHTRSTDHDGVTAAGSNCTSNCHDGSSGPNIVSNTHAGCDSCHTNTLLDGRLVGAATYGTASGSGSCNGCHSSPVDYTNAIDGFNRHLRSTDHDNLTAAVGCNTAGCHDNPDLISGVHDTPPDSGATYECQLCHTNLGADGTFRTDNSAQNAVAIFTGNDCTTCHSGGHNAEGDHDKLRKLDGGALVDGKECHICHTELGTPPYAFAGGIDQLHRRTGDGGPTCQSCHSYDENEGRTPPDMTNPAATPQSNVEGAIAAGKGTGGSEQTCVSCHVVASSAIPGHDAVLAHDFTMLERGKYESEGLSCGRCHHGNTAVEHVQGGAYCTELQYPDRTSCEAAGYFWSDNWGIAASRIDLWISPAPPANKCTICHDDGAGGPSSNPVVDAAITIGKGGTMVGCFNCHKEGNPQLFAYDPDNGGLIGQGDPKYPAGFTIPDGHHDGTMVQNGNCTACHTDPRTNPDLNFPTPAVLPCQNCHAVEDAVTDLLTIYREKNRVQDMKLVWDTKNLETDDVVGTMEWTITPNATCSDPQYTTQNACVNATPPQVWLPARAIANTIPSGTCNIGSGAYTDKKWECVDNGGKWTYDEAPGTGVDHQWQIFNGRGGSGGSVNTYGMCIFCHKMAPFHAKRLPIDDFKVSGSAIPGLIKGVCSTALESPPADPPQITSAECTAAGGTWTQPTGTESYDTAWNPYDDGWSMAPMHPGPGRAELSVFHEVAAYEDNYYHLNDYFSNLKNNEKGIWQTMGTQDGVPNPSLPLSYAMAVYQPQKICTDSRWKNSTDCTTNNNIWITAKSICSDPAYTPLGQTACESNTASWDHGSNAQKYIPKWWIGGAEDEYVRMVPVIASAPTDVTITNNGTSFSEVANYQYVTGSSFNFNVNVGGASCIASNCEVYAVVAGEMYQLNYQSGTNWTGASGAIQGSHPTSTTVPDRGDNKHIGAVRGSVDVHYVAVRIMADPLAAGHRKTLGYLNVTGL